MTFQTINPFNGVKEANFSSFTVPQIENSINKAVAAYREWSALPVQTRAGFIKKIGQALENNTERLARLVTLEMGKPIAQSIAEVKKCAWLSSHFATAGPDFLKEKKISLDDADGRILYQPLGVLLGVMPWNFPFWQALRFGVPALLAGNTILLKPAPNVPQCSLALEKLINEAVGMEAVFQTVFADVQQVEQILRHEKMAGVALTGSEKAGGSVAAIAGSEIKKCVLELGGSDAFLVLSDANIPAAAQAAVQSRMNNTGQTCIAAKRFIVEKSAADDFLNEVFNNYMTLKAGDPNDESVNLGPLARPDLLENLQSQVEKSIQSGAQILIDGGRAAYGSNFFRPMLLTNIQPGMPAFDQELFGPVATVFVVNDVAEAVKVANNTRFGLGAAIWSDDVEKANHVAEKLEAGAIAVNDFVRSDPRLPFGGIKKSGFGREMGLEGIREFVNIKTVVNKKI